MSVAKLTRYDMVYARHSEDCDKIGIVPLGDYVKFNEVISALNAMEPSQRDEVLPADKSFSPAHGEYAYAALVAVVTSPEFKALYLTKCGL